MGDELNVLVIQIDLLLTAEPFGLQKFVVEEGKIHRFVCTKPVDHMHNALQERQAWPPQQQSHSTHLVLLEHLAHLVLEVLAHSLAAVRLVHLVACEREGWRNRESEN